jgi:hypothetical protein
MRLNTSSRVVQATGSLFELLVYGKAPFDVLFGWRLAMSKRAPLRFRNRKLDHRLILLFDEALTFVTAHFEEVLPTLGRCRTGPRGFFLNSKRLSKFYQEGAVKQYRPGVFHCGGLRL